jgi:hypothetical protein
MPFIIDDDTKNDDIFRPEWVCGTVERDYSEFPQEMFEPQSQIPIIPRNEWDARLEEMERTQSSLKHIRDKAANGNPMPYLDQFKMGYCWTHSGVHAVMIARAVMNLPYVPLSAYSVAATIKKGANRGGWCGECADFLRKRGVSPQKTWPQGDANYRKYDRPEVWTEAAKFKTTEDWFDITRNIWDQRMTFDQAFSLLLQRIPLALDFNWWGHSVCGLFPVKVEANSYGIGILNSHLNFGENGVGILRGDRAIPNAGVGIRVVTAAA